MLRLELMNILLFEKIEFSQIFLIKITESSELPFLNSALMLFLVMLTSFTLSSTIALRLLFIKLKSRMSDPLELFLNVIVTLNSKLLNLLLITLIFSFRTIFLFVRNVNISTFVLPSGNSYIRFPSLSKKS